MSSTRPPSDGRTADERSPLLPLASSIRRRSQHDSDDTRTLAPRLVRYLAAFSLTLILVLTLAIVHRELVDRSDPRFGSGRNGRPYLARGTKGAVAAENEVCSKIGVQVLKENGTAVDAAIASTLCTGVLNMFSSGIGGGGFMIVRDPVPCSSSNSLDELEGEAGTSRHRKAPRLKHCAEHVVIDFRETGPALANATMYQGRPLAARFGGLSVAVPGELRGLEEAHKRWGRLPWKRLVEPSVELAKGARVSRELERRLAFSSFFGDFVTKKPEWREVFVNSDTGDLLKESETIRRRAYANTLHRIAHEGVSAFYEGDIARSMVDKVQSEGGILTLDDLKAYKVEVKPAIGARWYDRRVWTAPSPTSGPVLLSMLQVLSGFPNWIARGPNNALSTHRFIEASKFASAQRTELGDPNFLNSTSRARLDEIPTAKEAKKVRRQIDDDRTHDLDYYHPLFDTLEDHGTMSLSTVDKDGQAVALTSTVNLLFGSQVLDPATGIIMNDEMDDTSTPGAPNAFGLRPSPYNYPGPGKRPLSSMAPTIVEHPDGSFHISLGGSGGSRIFGSVAQVLLNLDWGMDVSQAIERPRIHHQLLPAFVSVETGVEKERVEALKERGHDVQEIDINIAVAEVQAVVRELPDGKSDEATIFAASDSRKGGKAAAY